MKIVIVGGVAGGATAAARARRLSESAEIILFERGPEVSFANCGLPYYIGGEIAERPKLLIVTPELLRKRFRLDVRVRTSVEAIDRASKTVRVRNLETGQESTESYDKLVLSPGAGPIRPDIPGADLPGIFTLRDLPDADRIKQVADDGVRRAVVIGGGYIGLEMVENLVRRGVPTTLVQAMDQLLGPFDREMTTPIESHLAEQGVDVLLNETAVGFSASRDGLDVRLASGRSLSAQLVVMGIGVRPETTLARAAGLAIGDRGGIRVNAQMQTDDPDIYAVGDAVEVEDYVLGNPALISLAGPANRQGRLAVNHIFGLKQSRYRGTQGTAIIGVLGKTMAMTGASEKALKRAGRPHRKIYIHPMHHAGYYPGAKQFSMKVLFDPESGKLLGAQAVGDEGVDKQIDVLAMAIQAGLTVFDLEEAELCYAPQYGSAKSPVNMAGFVASGLIRGEHPQIDLESAIDGGAYLLDVRTPAEFASGHVPGARNVPIDELRERLDEIPRDRPIAAYCQVGQRGLLATRVLVQNGFSAANVGGGYKTYRLHHPG